MIIINFIFFLDRANGLTGAERKKYAEEVLLSMLLRFKKTQLKNF